MINDENYLINGQVFHEKTKKGLPGLRVEAWDKDRISKDDYLGSAQTDDAGRFTLRFTSAQFREWFFDRKPDLFFRVYDGDTLVKDTIDDVLWNVDRPEIEIVIAVDIPIEPGEEAEEEQEPVLDARANLGYGFPNSDVLSAVECLQRILSHERGRCKAH